MNSIGAAGRCSAHHFSIRTICWRARLPTRSFTSSPQLPHQLEPIDVIAPFDVGVPFLDRGVESIALVIIEPVGLDRQKLDLRAFRRLGSLVEHEPAVLYDRLDCLHTDILPPSRRRPQRRVSRREWAPAAACKDLPGVSQSDRIRADEAGSRERLTYREGCKATRLIRVLCLLGRVRVPLRARLTQPKRLRFRFRSSSSSPPSRRPTLPRAMGPRRSCFGLRSGLRPCPIPRSTISLVIALGSEDIAALDAIESLGASE